MPLQQATAFADLATLGRQLRSGETTALELAEFFLDRVERLGPRYNAVVTVTRELAMQQARQADADLAAGHDRGPLHGIPYGAKDLLATAGIPTSWGAEPFRQQVFDHDATVVRKLREAGAVLVAKLAMVEIAGGLGYRQANASFTGPGLNPWNRGAWSGGSSSGSGSAVAAGLAPFAIGSETWGSIVTPAGYCGVTGLRPTYGRVSRHGAMALSWTMDKLGPMARSAADCGQILAAIAGADEADPSAVDRPFVWPAENPSTRFKLATVRGACDRVQPEVRANFERSVEALKAIADVAEIELPDYPYSPVAGTIVDCESAAAFEGLVASGDIERVTAPEDRVGLQAKLLIPAKDYINALRIRRVIQRALDAWLQPFDAAIVPALAAVANPLETDFGEYQRAWRDTDLSGGENVAGLPGVCVPNGFGERGLPTALLFVGRAFDEARLLDLASRYQQGVDWHLRRPPLDDNPADDSRK